MGENEESASPADPIFWTLHPTVERLWQLKKLSGSFTDETWPSHGTSQYGDSCSGHRAFDEVSFVDLVPGNDTPFTLEEVLELMDPNQGDLPYIYEDLKWDYCDDAGLPFGAGLS